MALGPFFGWLVPAMLFANFVTSLVRPARRALESEASGRAGTNFRDSNRDLLRIAAVTAPAGLGVALIAAVF